MVWRSVMISQPARLRCEHFSLAIEQQQTSYIPFEDIAIIVLDHKEIVITHPVLSKCAEQGISLFSTGQDHLPNGIFLPYLQYIRTTKLLRLQQNLKKTLVKKAWTVIVQQKILNQAHCLLLVKPDQEKVINLLHNLAKKVRSGDTNNIEAQAAQRYFSVLFNLGFQRKQTNVINSALNYGYAIFRGAIARGLVAHGLFPPFWIFHNSELNAFNLADDLIEPFRPVIDLWVVNHTIEQQQLTTLDKAALVRLLHTDIEMPTGTMSVLSAIEQCVESLVRYLETSGEQDLALPILLAEQKHLQRLQVNLPPEGSIRLLTVTEKQFATMILLLGKPKNQEKKVNAEQFLLF